MSSRIPSIPPPRVPAGKIIRVAADMPDWAPEYDNGSGPIVAFHQDFFLEYGDYAGRASARRITTRSLRLWDGHDIALWAWCHERKAPRTFLASRISGLTDAVTGEVFEDPESWLHAEYEASPEVEDERERDEEEQAALEEERLAQLAEREAAKAAKQQKTNRLRFARTAVLALVYVAKADGRMDAAERAAIGGFIRELAQNNAVDLAWSNPQERLRKLSCDQAEFLEGLKLLRAGPQDLRATLMRAADALIMVDGEAHQDEHRAVSWLKVMLKA